MISDANILAFLYLKLKIPSFLCLKIFPTYGELRKPIMHSLCKMGSWKLKSSIRWNLPQEPSPHSWPSKKQVSLCRGYTSVFLLSAEMLSQRKAEDRVLVF